MPPADHNQDANSSDVSNPGVSNRDVSNRDASNRDVRDAGSKDAGTREARRWAALAALAPGTMLRDGLERILRGNTGALIVLGDGPAVDEVCTGGFELRVPFSATRLRELAKMDGAIVLDAGAGYIVRAAVHLVPDPTLPTDESGTRHRTAERVGRQTGCPVISVSKSMRIIALYLDGARYVLEDSAAILSRANQALATLERYKLRLDEVSGTLTAHEIEDVATARDVTAVAQRLEMVRRIAGEIEGYKIELGTDGRLLALQLDELIAGSDFERQLVVQDYLPAPPAVNPLARAGRGARASWGGCPPKSCWTWPRWPPCWDWAGRACSTSRSSPGDTGCWPGSRGCPGRRPNGWWRTSAGCTSCWRPAWPNCRRSTA